MWYTDDPPTVPCDGSLPLNPPALWFPQAGGTRLMIETIGPHFGITRPSGRLPIHEEKADGTDLSQFNAHYRDSSGMHSSDSVDYAIVISGQTLARGGDGTEIMLEAGDCVVRTGVRHTWRNRSASPCQVAFVLIGAVRTGDPEESFEPAD
jgi:hypothetical protein